MDVDGKRTSIDRGVRRRGGGHANPHVVRAASARWKVCCMGWEMFTRIP